MPKVTVSTIIVSYNTAQLTAKSVQAVIDEYDASKIDGEIIVVDNNSSDESVQLLEKLFKNNIHLIKSQRNLGFSKGNNLGVSKAQGKYIFFLNSDAFIHKSAIKHLLHVFEKYPDRSTAQQAHTALIDRAGIVSGMLLNSDGTVQKQGGALPSLWTLLLWWLLPLPAGISLIPHRWSYHIEDESFFWSEQKIGWLGGTALMVRRELLDEIGGFDESIFMYAEDVELCLRATKHHWDVVYTPSAKITHLASASSSASTAIIGEVVGIKYVAQKHSSFFHYLLILKILKLGTILRYLVFGIILRHETKQKVYKEIYSKLQEN